LLEGNVRHRDSLGNQGLIGPGDLQWMTSGRGILHEELPHRGPSGRVNGFQLWVNLPAAQKMDPPRYQDVVADQVPVIEKEGAEVRLVAGEFEGVRGPVTEIAIQPLYMDVTLRPGASFELPVPAGHAAYAYVFEGAGEFGGEKIEAVKMVVFGDGDKIAAKTENGLRFVLMAGKPIGETIVPYGPFVMNTEAEIKQVFEDIKSGNFAKPW
jgi:redox-sensitive bicupin YhaK (pirin superfamily)